MPLGERRPSIQSLDELATTFRGRLLGPDDVDYGEVRVVQNAMFDRRPGMIVECSGTADVIDLSFEHARRAGGSRPATGVDAGRRNVGRRGPRKRRMIRDAIARKWERPRKVKSFTSTSFTYAS